MAKKSNYQSITLYKDMAPQILELEKVEAGEILQAIMKYSCYGEDTDMSQYDRFVRSLWKTVKLKLDAGEAYDREISETNRTNAMKRWEKEKGDTTAYDRKQSNKTDTTAYDRTTYTDTVTGTISSTNTNSSTVTNTETEESDSADCHSASATANAEPPASDLFSLRKIQATAKRNKVNLTKEGIEAFYEEMQETEWILYNRPVTKRGIIKAMRGWAKYHPEYAVESYEVEDKKEEELVIKHKTQDVQEETDWSDPDSLIRYLKKEYGEDWEIKSGFSESEIRNELEKGM